jgi:hypothetical protein
MTPVVSVAAALICAGMKKDYPLVMRFRSKFGLLRWVYIALACFFAYLCLWGRTSATGLYGVSAALWVIAGASLVLNSYFVYWELDSVGICENWFWKKREVRWEEVTRVGCSHPKAPKSGYLEVDYVRPAPISLCGHIRANPGKRQEFLAELRRFATNADFDV